MAEQGFGPQPAPRQSTVKSHHNDSEPQLKESMKDLQPNKAPDPTVPHYVISGGRIINERDSVKVPIETSGAAANDEELQKKADEMNEAVKKAVEQGQQADEQARQEAEGA